jgi:hypothetical protein
VCGALLLLVAVVGSSRKNVVLAVEVFWLVSPIFLFVEVCRLRSIGEGLEYCL